jgi:hypothetical protein
VRKLTNRVLLQAKKEQQIPMKLIVKTSCFAVLLVCTLFLSSCYPAHSGSGGSLSGSGGSGGSGGTGGSGGSGGGGGNGTPSTFTIGGAVIGLVGTGLVLENNGSEDLPITVNGTYTFKVAVSGPYSVVVKTQPTGPAQTCTVANGTGTATANVANVVINCGTTGLTVGGSVSGLLGSGLVLQNNGGDNFPVSGKGNVPFTFTTPLASGAAYAVTILTQPSNPPQVCSVVNGSGTVTSNVNNVQISCTQPGFTISGSVVGLVEGPGDTLELQDNAGDDLFVTGDTVFTFPTKVTNGGIYNVKVFLNPNSQPQPCVTYFYTGIAITNVSDILVDCEHNDWAWGSWYLGQTTSANNYAVVTTPLQPPNQTFPPNVSTPGGRDFAATWTDNSGRKWLFGGLGFPFPDPLGRQNAAFLNDLWVFDGSVGGWVPANLPIFSSGTLPPINEVRTGPLELEDVPTGVAPGSRWGSSSWTDTATGDLFLFGGQGTGSTGSIALLNDLWKCTPGVSVDAQGAGTSSCPWTHVSGATTGNTSGVYGTQGAPGGVPGGRWAAATTTDASGHVWLFGGQGVDSAGTTGLLNDLWEFTGGAWTWIGPSNSNIANQNGIYGTQGTGSGTNAPGARQAAVLWADTSGNIWLFGGFGLDSAGTGLAGPPPAGAILNDLWEFNITTKQWIWVSGSNLANQTGVYGSQATSNLSTGAATSVPGSRWGAVGWSDTNSNLWFFGGWGYGTTVTLPTGFLDDIWEYQHSSGQWIWWKGISNVNQNSVFATIPIPFADGTPFVNNVVGGRRGAAIWPQPDPEGFIWMFGGEGYDASQGDPPGYLNDLWMYLPFPN